jgi:cation-transporting ATPase I
LNARQLLLMNLFTDLVPAMALAVRPPAGTDPSRLAREGPEASLGSALSRDVLVRGAVTAAAGGFGWQAGRVTGVSRRRAGTVALVSLVGSQLGQTFAAGWRNPLVVGSTVASGLGLAAVVQTPGVSQFFGCRPLGPVGWGIGGVAAAGSSLAAPLVHGLLDRVRPPGGPSATGAAGDHRPGAGDRGPSTA